MDFYGKVLAAARRDHRVTGSNTVLVLCGGKLDRDHFFDLGFENVTLSNLNDFMGEGIAPYQWERVDAEDIHFADESFDVVAVHGGLHHCQSPHRALVEMYRVARKAVVVIEARESLSLRLAKRLGLTSDYEIEAVTGSRDYGGLRGGPIPNFIYRWTEREVRKVMASYAPQYQHEIEFYYGLLLPHLRLSCTNRPLIRLVLALATPFAFMLQKLLPAQGNEFGWIVRKDRPVLQPWIKAGVLDRAYVEDRGLKYQPPAQAA